MHCLFKTEKHAEGMGTLYLLVYACVPLFKEAGQKVEKKREHSTACWCNFWNPSGERPVVFIIMALVCHVLSHTDSLVVYRLPSPTQALYFGLLAITHVPWGRWAWGWMPSKETETEIILWPERPFVPRPVACHHSVRMSHTVNGDIHLGLGTTSSLQCVRL